MRRIYRTTKSALVLGLVFMMTIDTANACRLFHWISAHRAACSPATAQDLGVSLNCGGATPVCSAPVVESYPVANLALAASPNCCCCCNQAAASYPGAEFAEGPIVDAGYPSEGFSESYLETYPESYSEPYMDGGYTEEAPQYDASPVDLAPSDTMVTPADDFVPTPAALPAETNDSAAVVAPEPEPAAAPADENPLNDADDPNEFSAVPDDAPTGDGGVFDNASGAAGADDADGNADGGGLFDEAPVGDTTPALGGDGGGGLFDEAPAGGPDAGDGGLFDEAPAVDGADDGGGLFDAPPAGDADVDGGLFDAAPAGDEGTDGLFNMKESKDDLFSKARRDGMRNWIDNTGTYETVGRLVLIAKTHIRILKENGRFSTVPLTRLSEQDLDYVMAVAAKLTAPQRLARR